MKTTSRRVDSPRLAEDDPSCVPTVQAARSDLDPGADEGPSALPGEEESRPIFIELRRLNSWEIRCKEVPTPWMKPGRRSGSG